MKRNQPTLHAALAGLPSSAVDRQVSKQFGHGRGEPRSIAVLDVAGAPGIDGLFPYAAQVMRVIRPRTHTATGKRSPEVVYAITSLDHRRADPGLLAGWLEGHWGIENRVHHVRDVTRGEDGSPTRTGDTAQHTSAGDRTCTSQRDVRPGWPRHGCRDWMVVRAPRMVSGTGFDEGLELPVGGSLIGGGAVVDLVLHRRDRPELAGGGVGG
ncbi:hypothetical protein SAMN05661080_02005 [Modestobacter sp. DSM 44400]|nr:hypothetical protein SAMN05661080_02005 [Modestobacter sp. DSM 44400]